ncbi:MAG: pantoate--beta-alanine ligase [Elusimicrobiota bacterium]|nr:pantoate--beta-alanine ligase [Elusimicrobiota bacterium]
MLIIKKVTDWKSLRSSSLLRNQKLGFVPTMGALHPGHLSLIKKSKKENQKTVVSIFINPTQFNDKKDLKKYPRTLNDDIKKLRTEKVDFLFQPDAKEIYSDKFNYKVSENNISRIMCGAFRPGHFDGVLTVVMKLLNIIEAENAYFGEKDYQQYRLVKDMAKAFFLKTKIIPLKIIREKDGLAMSSRNRLLKPSERQIAPKLNEFLNSKKSSKQIMKLINSAGFKTEYIKEIWKRRFISAKLGKVRLIDNVKIKG